MWSAWTRGHILGSVARRCRRERVVREVLQCFKQAFFKPRRTLLMSVTAAYNSRSEESSDRDVGITDDELEVWRIPFIKVTHVIVSLTIH